MPKRLCQKSAEPGLCRLKPSGQHPGDDQDQDQKLQRPNKLLSSRELSFFPRLSEPLLGRLLVTLLGHNP